MIDVLFAGYSYTHKDGLVYDTSKGRGGYDCYQLIYTHTPAMFWVEGELRKYPAKSVVFFTPGHRKYYMSLPDEPYTNDWVRFKSDEKFIENFPKKNIPYSPSDAEFVHEIIKLITWESESSNGEVKDRNIRNLFELLISKLSAEAENIESTPYHHEFTELRRDIVHHPEKDWTIDMMASRINLSRTRFQTVYKTTFGNTCMEEVIQARVKLAQERLIYTGHTISEIAEICGYNSTEHFCRQFRKSVGITPGQFRRNAQKNG